MPSSAAEPLALIACLLLAGCAASEAAAPPPSPFVATAQGRIDARGETRWLAAEVDARIAAVPVAEGDAVAAGAVLMQLACADRTAHAKGLAASADAAAAEARLVAAGARAESRTEARARLAAAEAALADARDAHDRAAQLLAGGWVTSRQMQHHQAAVDAANGERAAAAAALAALDNGARPDERAAAEARAQAAAAMAAESAALADRCTLRAPVAGRVLRILRREGEFSGAGSGHPIIAIADTSALMVRAEVLDRDAATIRPGQRATIWLDEGAGRWQGRVLDGALLVGRRTSRSLDPADRFDRDVREVRVLIEGAPPAIIGLRVNVGFARS